GRHMVKALDLADELRHAGRISIGPHREVLAGELGPRRPAVPGRGGKPRTAPQAKPQHRHQHRSPPREPVYPTAPPTLSEPPSAQHPSRPRLQASSYRRTYGSRAAAASARRPRSVELTGSFEHR